MFPLIMNSLVKLNNQLFIQKHVLSGELVR